MFAVPTHWRRRGPGRGVPSALLVMCAAGCSGERTSTMPVAPMVPVASVTVTPAQAVLIVRATQQFAATTRDAAGGVLTGRAVQWSTSDASKATVSETGLVSALADGAVRIIATSEGTVGVVDAFSVTLPVASVAVTPATATLRTGQTQLLTATPLSNTGQVLPGQRDVTWSSSDSTIATVDANGLVTARATGSAVIIASCEGQSGVVRISITP